MMRRLAVATWWRNNEGNKIDVSCFRFAYLNTLCNVYILRQHSPMFLVFDYNRNMQK
jgi:hypothetical protein